MNQANEISGGSGFKVYSVFLSQRWVVRGGGVCKKVEHMPKLSQVGEREGNFKMGDCNRYLKSI